MNGTSARFLDGVSVGFHSPGFRIGVEGTPASEAAGVAGAGNADFIGESSSAFVMITKAQGTR